MDTRQQTNETVSSDEWYTPRWLIDELDLLVGEYELKRVGPVLFAEELHRGLVLESGDVAVRAGVHEELDDGEGVAFLRR